MSRADLPPAVVAARELLAEHGPLGVGELSAMLMERGVYLRPSIGESLADRYPDQFSTTDEGRVCLPVQAGGAVPEPLVNDGVAPLWWTKPADDCDPLPLDGVVVLDIETTGLDPDIDEVLQIAAFRFADRALLFKELPPTAGAALLQEALTDLGEFLDGAHAIAGHRVGQFDLPFLAKIAKRQGVTWDCDLPELDTHLLSVVALPTVASRTLSDLADELGVALDQPHHAEADVRATAAIIENLLERYNPDDPSWALTQRLLAEAGEPWARMLAPGDVPKDLAFLDAARDSLVHPPEVNPSWRTAAAAVGEGFVELEHRGFLRRDGQLQMATAVAEALDDEASVAVEAPTGTGKSLGYLIPAIGAAGGRRPVVVATHTKALQHQLRQDAERLRAMGLLNVPFRQLQGIANYLCTREIVDTIITHDARGDEWTAVAVAVRSLGTVPTGLWTEVTDGLVRRSALGYAQRRSMLVATPHTCDRSRCDFVRQCPYFQRLERVDENPGILAVNHALVGAWAALAQQDIKAPGDVLAEGRASIIFDEAHVLEDALTSAWTDETGALDLSGLLGGIFGRHGPVRRAQEMALSEALKDTLRQVVGQRTAVGASVDALNGAVALYLHEFGGRESVVELRFGLLRSQPEFRVLASAVLEVIAAFRGLKRGLVDLATALSGSPDDPAPSVKGVHRVRSRLFGLGEELEERIELLRALYAPEEQHRFVYLLGLETEGQLEERAVGERWQFERIPIDISEQFRRHVVDRARSVVLTSATLRVGESFDFVGERLGCTIGDDDDADMAAVVVESPFDVDRQSAAILTSHLPLPVPGGEREFCEELAADQVGFLSLTGGKTLTLFAARSRMEHVAALVRGRERELEARGVQLLVQGEESTARLSEHFRSHAGSVLYGLRTFWEGFDAPGDTLSYLVIEKPPWPHPGDPVTAARQRLILERGGDPFLDYAVPKTAIALAQGFGRLIRSETDRGVALFCDRRMTSPTRAYQQLLATLPTRSIMEAEDRDDAWRMAITFVTGVEPDLSAALDLPLGQMASLIEELRILPGEDPTEKLRIAAREIFGIETLRDEQLTLMRALLEGRDVLGFLPTGFGKSICFQLPALLHPHHRPTVVVSPLVALIKDQVDLLRSQKGLRSVRGITGRTSRLEREDTMRRLADGRVDLVYVSPERLVRDGVLSAALAHQQLGAVVVDEAHCVSSWGHDFRPEFRQVVKPLLAFERSARAGLTATATPDVEADVTETLDLDAPVVVRIPVDRADLRYWVKRMASERERTRELLRFIASQGDTPGIVYASRRALTEQLAWIVRQAGHTARSYHAGMLPEQRDAVQDDFRADATQIVVATKAFGMGIDKPNIGWVVHYDLPDSAEAYAQEAGRAARRHDLEGECVLLFTGGDIARRRAQAGRTQTDIDKAEDLLALVAHAPMRGQCHLIDPDDLAEKLQIEPEQLNVLVAWLEQCGALDRRQDATTSGWIETGRREPKDPDEKLAFVDLVKFRIGTRPGTRRKVDLEELAVDTSTSADALERQLVDWSLAGLISFSPIHRLWQIHLLDHGLDRRRLEKIVDRWAEHERARVEQIIRYADASECRREAIARVFGDPPLDCRSTGGRLCDVCDGGEPHWHSVPISRVPDPENLVDVELVVLQAVRWSLRAADRGYNRRYGEVGLLAALAGQESLGPHPLSPALFNCPQFGAVRYVRAANRRLKEAVQALIDKGALLRERASRAGTEYSTLTLTEVGRAMLGGTLG